MVVVAADTNSVDQLLRLLRREPGNPVYQDQLRAALPSIKDTNDLQYALAAYCVGRLINEDLRGAQQARDALAYKFTNSPLLQELRIENLVRSCPRCEGDGKTLAKACEHCNGSRRCTICGGRGFDRITKKDREKCGNCNGTGRCHWCDARGRVEGPCEECNGKGRIFDYRKMRETARGILQPYGRPGDRFND